MRFDFKATYVYYILIAATILTLFFYRGDDVLVPQYPALSFILFLIFGMVHQGWSSFKLHGRVCVTNLERNSGGHSTYHPDDVRIAFSKDDQPSFMVMAQGGFDYNTLSIQGKDRFLVFPPEHAEEKNAGIVVHTKFRRVDLDDLPDYIQSELMQLKHFNAEKVRMKNNLYFGATAEKFMTDTESNKKLESKFLDQTSQLNYYKRIIQDLTKKGPIAPWTKKEEGSDE